MNQKSLSKIAAVACSHNMVALVDAEDLNKVKGYCWDGGDYPRTTNKDGFLVSMHYFIVSQKSGYVIDHINSHTFDNRKCNLRYATVAQNLQNKHKPRSRGLDTTAYKGIFRCKIHGVDHWKSTIKVKGKTLHLGSFRREATAAKAYDAAARKYFGEFARLNFPKPGEQPAVIITEVAA